MEAHYRARFGATPTSGPETRSVSAALDAHFDYPICRFEVAWQPQRGRVRIGLVTEALRKVSSRLRHLWSGALYECLL